MQMKERSVRTLALSNVAIRNDVSPITQSHPEDIQPIGLVLRIGSVVSSVVILLGIVLLFLSPGSISQQVQIFPHTAGQLWMGLLAWQPQAIIVLGLLILIATPFMRVTTAAIIFGRAHDWRYVMIALIVLTILLASLLLGKGGA